MNQRALGDTGILVSELGLGSSALSGGLFNRDHTESLAVLQAAYDSGITFFDTGENYGLGLHEKLIGRAFGRCRDKVVIATKGGLQLSRFGRLGIHLRPILVPFRGLLKRRRRALGLLRDSQKSYRFDAQHMRRACEGSLRRLNTDYVDLYQFYNVTDSALARDDLFEVMGRLKEEGKIRAGGATIIKIHTAFDTLRHEGMQTIQVPLSVFDQVTVKQFLPTASSRGVTVIGRSPLGAGMLTDDLGFVKAMESSHISEGQLAERKATAAKLRELLEEGETLAQFALKYALAQKGVSSVLFSAATRSQLTEDLASVGQSPLSAERMRAAEAMVPAPPESTVPA